MFIRDPVDTEIRLDCPARFRIPDLPAQRQTGTCDFLRFFGRRHDGHVRIKDENGGDQPVPGVLPFRPNDGPAEGLALMVDGQTDDFHILAVPDGNRLHEPVHHEQRAFCQDLRALLSGEIEAPVVPVSGVEHDPLGIAAPVSPHDVLLRRPRQFPGDRVYAGRYGQRRVRMLPAESRCPREPLRIVPPVKCRQVHISHGSPPYRTARPCRKRRGRARTASPVPRSAL